MLSKSFYVLISFLTLGVLSLNKVFAVVYKQGQSETSAGQSSTVGDVESGANKIIANFLFIIYFLITLYVFFGAFNILTAAGDEEKVKKGKTIIIHAVIGFIVVFLTGSIVKFIFASITTTTV